LERFEVPNMLGSHHGESRMFRLCYYEHPGYVPLLRRALELWRGLEAEAGAKLFYETGALYMGPEDGDLVGGSLRSAREHGLDHELLSHGELARRFPQFRVPADYVGFYEPLAGLIVPEAAVRAMVGLARAAGAEVRTGEPVLEWSAEAGGAQVRTAAGTYRAERLIFTAGAWTSKLVADLGTELTVTRQMMGWFRPRSPAPFTLGAFPCWGLESPDGSLLYGFPMLPGAAGLKVARHAKGTVTDPDHLKREPVAADEGELRPALRRHLPEADGPLVSMLACMYTNSVDSHFVLDRHPRYERVHLMCGSSGHGFKFAPVIGEILADLALTGRTEQPVEFLGFSRGRSHL
jgi:sarcosine oxidase